MDSRVQCAIVAQNEAMAHCCSTMYWRYCIITLTHELSAASRDRMPSSAAYYPTGVVLGPNSPKFRLSGRWVQPSLDAGSRTASWCGASISLLFSGKFLRLRTGPRTERKDAFNGGTPMIACSVAPFNQDAGREEATTYDCGPSQEITLLDANSLATQVLPVKVTITLIDWASVFELESIIVDCVCGALRRYIPF